MKNFFYAFLVVFTTGLNAQTPFWTEDFANGIPAGWTNADVSNQNVLWSWCSDPANAGTEAGCPKIWNDATNSQVPFQAATAENGFITLDSDKPGNLANDHLSEITTTAINCSDKAQVYIRFETHLGTYTYDADDRALVRVSTDQVTWTPYQVFSGLTTGVRWSENPFIAIIDISPTAASQTTVYIQWQWSGNWEYNWNIDDIEIYSENPTPKNDLALADIFFPLSSYATPASEIKTDTCIFYAYLNNNGLEDQPNVKLKAWVTDSNNAVLFADSTIIDVLPVGYKDSLVVLPNLFVPDVTEGLYQIHYTVSNESPDGRDKDNVRTTEFAATNNYYAKEDDPEQFFRPSTLTDPWYVGNYYRTSASSVEKYKAVSIDFAHTTNADEIEINQVTAGAYLLRVNDDIDSELSNLNEAEFFASFEWQGLGEYIAEDSVADDGGIRTVDLIDLATGEPGVEIETGARYLAAISYAGDNRFVFQGYNNDNKYFFTSTLQYGGGSYYSFGDDVNAVVRLNLSLLSTSDEVPLPDGAMSVFPNPATDQVNLDIQLTTDGPATVTIADLSGRIILSQDYDHLQQQTLSYKLPKMASGIYLARIATKTGTLTKRFTKI